MATAELKDIEEFVEVKQIKSVITKKYVVQMSMIEVQFLVDLLGYVGGSPDCSRRKHGQAIFDALVKLKGISFPSGACDIKPMPGLVNVEDTFFKEK